MKQAWWVALLALFLLPGLVLAQADERAEEPVFGVIEAYYRPAEAAELGAAWDRIIFHWDAFQPAGPDDWDTSAVPAEYLSTAREAGRQVVGLIKATPPWASDSGTPGGVPRGLHLPYDDPDNVFGAFVTRLVEEYAPLGVHDWIIWNEPDIRPGEGIPEFEGEVEDYAALVRTAYQAVKAADPSAHVQLAGTTYWHDANAFREPYLRRLLRALFNDPQAAANDYYFDGVTLHIYFTTWTVQPIIDQSNDILWDYGLQNKEVWLSEFNASPRRDPEAEIDAMFEVSLEQQSDFIVQAAALALSQGVDRMAVYRLYDNAFTPGVSEPWGLVRGDGSLRPAFSAYQQVIKRFGGATRVEYTPVEGGDLVTFRFPDRTLYAMWSSAFEGGTFMINAGGLEGPLTVFDAEGSATELELTEQSGAPFAVIEALPAEQIDMPWVVVAGPVRLLELPGPPRTVVFRNAQGVVTQVR
ncbi:MAG: hypothetical protein JNL34_08950 [Anaerolineae bacterium]|nr:hypothetical protein [Anaerolineae bacterium]